MKALKYALKGQNFAPDTLEILLANAYHWNPCWKVEEQCHIFGWLHCTSTKTQLFLLLILCHDFSSITLYLTWFFDFGVVRLLFILCFRRSGDFQPITELSSVRWRFSTNHRALVSKVAIFNQSQQVDGYTTDH